MLEFVVHVSRGPCPPAFCSNVSFPHHNLGGDLPPCATSSLTLTSCAGSSTPNSVGEGLDLHLPYLSTRGDQPVERSCLFGGFPLTQPRNIGPSCISTGSGRNKKNNPSCEMFLFPCVIACSSVALFYPSLKVKCITPMH